jgi:hypothetical protein
MCGRCPQGLWPFGTAWMDDVMMQFLTTVLEHYPHPAPKRPAHSAQASASHMAMLQHSLVPRLSQPAAEAFAGPGGSSGRSWLGVGADSTPVAGSSGTSQEGGQCSSSSSSQAGTSGIAVGGGGEGSQHGDAMASCAPHSTPPAQAQQQQQQQQQQQGASELQQGAQVREAPSPSEPVATVTLQHTAGSMGLAPWRGSDGIQGQLWAARSKL